LRYLFGENNGFGQLARSHTQTAAAWRRRPPSRRRDPFDAIEPIRQDERFANLRVMAVTAHAMAGDREGILASGFDGRISKPVNAAIFKQRVREFAGSGSARLTPNPQTGGDIDQPLCPFGCDVLFVTGQIIAFGEGIQWIQ
jgi:hypothetical protein